LGTCTVNGIGKPLFGGADLFGDNMKLTKKHFGKKPEKKPEGKKIDPIKELKRAYAEPQKVARVGGKGYV